MGFFDLEYDKIVFSKFDLMIGNFPAFYVITSESNVALIFSVHGIKLVQVGREIDLGNGSEFL